MNEKELEKQKKNQENFKSHSIDFVGNIQKKSAKANDKNFKTLKLQEIKLYEIQRRK